MPERDPFREQNPFPNPLTGKMAPPPRPQRQGKNVFGLPTPGLSPGTRGPQQKPLNVPRIDQQRPQAVPPQPQEEDWQRVRREHIIERQRIDELNKKIGGQGGGTPYPDYLNPADPNPNDLFSERQRQEHQGLLAEAQKKERRRKASYLGPQGNIVHPVARYAKGWNMGQPVAGM